ncbi:WD40/YVTN/BNR-like repeat-containing protein [Dokdonella sp.]|uniref:WD40/YVTN/BNR-like repeat-containing protein n=1 Tax=Dokdonella sp. TaxID=2291710 RepID=UPI003C3AEFAC
MQRLKTGLAAASLALAALSIGPAVQAQESANFPADPLLRPVEIMPLANQAMMLDITPSGDRFIAVGERGEVMTSADGNEWVQSAGVPLRSTLTAVTAVGNQAWAVGHDGVILHSSDGGENWEIQRRDPRGQPAEGIDPYDLRQGAPFLDVLFTDSNNGMAIGAYSLFLTTRDGGKTWNGSRIPTGQPDSEAGQDPTDDILMEDDPAAGDLVDDNEFSSQVFSDDELKIGMESDPHLNGIARTGSGGLVIVGERGAIFRSEDGGLSWTRSQLPYDGSMFGVVGFEGQRVVAFGLRGHVFESTDLGVNWTEVPTSSELSLMGGTALGKDGVVIVGANGIILSRANASEPLKIATDTAAGVIAGVQPVGNDGDLLIASENGLSRFQPK